jgi:hypothetical protein
MDKLAFTRACLSDVGAIIVIIRVPLVELLCQAVIGWISALEYLLSGACGACGHVLSYQAVKDGASRDPVTPGFSSFLGW